MARFSRAPGACPVCDLPVPRTIHAGMETFHCPTHGKLDYAPGYIPLEAMGHAIRGFAADLAMSQPLTGLELVH